MPVEGNLAACGSIRYEFGGLLATNVASQTGVTNVSNGAIIRDGADNPADPRLVEIGERSKARE